MGHISGSRVRALWTRTPGDTLPRTMSREVIAADGLGKRFGDAVALRGVSFACTGPGLVGILGPNGSGKTTLIDLLLGLAEPSEGRARVFGVPVDPRRYPRRRVGVVLQREFVQDRITVGEYAGLFAAIYEVPDGRARILAESGLVGRERVAVERLSGGEAQRLFLAAAVVHGPELVFLDEPGAHLDPEARASLHDWLRALGRRCTVVLCTHDLREADALCDQLVLLLRGELRAAGPRDELVRAAPVRSGLGVEDAYFHFCAARIAPDGGLQ